MISEGAFYCLATVGSQFTNFAAIATRLTGTARCTQLGRSKLLSASDIFIAQAYIYVRADWPRAVYTTELNNHGSTGKINLVSVICRPTFVTVFASCMRCVVCVII